MLGLQSRYLSGEPATPDPADVYATGLRHTPMWKVNLKLSSNFYSRTLNLLNREARPLVFKDLNSTTFLTYIIAIKVEVGA
jgi:hypothetical protein